MYGAIVAVVNQNVVDRMKLKETFIFRAAIVVADPIQGFLQMNLFIIILLQIRRKKEFGSTALKNEKEIVTNCQIDVNFNCMINSI